MGTTQSKTQTYNTIEEDSEITPQVVQLIVKSTEKFDNFNSKSFLEKAESIFSVIDMLNGWCNKLLDDSSCWLEVENEKLRQDLAEIISEYGSLLPATRQVITNVRQLCADWELQLNRIQIVQKYVSEGKTKKAIAKAREVETEKLLKTIDHEPLEKLIMHYENLLALIDIKMKQINVEKETTTKKMWYCIGIAALSGLIFIGSLALIVASAGSATPAVVGGGFAAQASIGAGASFGFGIGVGGAVGFGATLITSSVLAASLYEMRETMTVIHDGLLSANEQLTTTHAALLHIPIDLTNGRKAAESLTNYLTDPDLVETLNPNLIESVKTSTKRLHKTVVDIDESLVNHHEIYRKKLISIQMKLQYS